MKKSKTLTDKEFINLLKNYPRSPRQFYVAVDAEDTVSSQYLFRTMDGRDLKPDDYIQTFEKFVKDNPDHIEAISIILNKPKGWNTQALRDLRTALQQRPERFTEDNLRKAYKYPLADIISMIKHAAKDEPIMSAKERVDLAIVKVLDDKPLTDRQHEWVELIKKHLTENLTIEPDDFDAMPIFANRGGSFKRVDQDFDGNLMLLIKELNSAMPQVYSYATN